MKRKHIGYWLAAIGIMMHLASLLLLRPMAEDYAARVQDRMATDPEFTPFYEQWESDANFDVALQLNIPFVYLPATISAIITTAFLQFKGKDSIQVAIKAFCISLGIFSLLYIIFSLANSGKV